MLISTAGASLPLYFFKNKKQQWTFLERDSEIFNATKEYIIKNFVPLHKEFPVSSDNIRNFKKFYQGTEQIILEEVKKSGLKEKIHYDITATRQFYGVPEELKYAKPLLKYCKKAHEFLYSELSGLKQMNVAWEIIKKNQDYTYNYHGKGLIGRCMYEITRIKAVNEEDTTKNIFITKIEPSVNSFYFEYRDLKISWFIFIASGRNALMAPFSELIPFSIAEASERFEKKAGFEKADQARESISEGLSYFLAMQLAEKLRITNGIKYISQNLEQLVSLNAENPYKYVPNAVRWIQKNTTQKALDLYLDSPERFMNKIQNF